MDTPDDLRSLAGIKTSADDALFRRIAAAKFIYWAESLLLVAVVAVTLWVANNDRRVSELRKDVDANIETLKAVKPKVDEMWWMKQNGIANGVHPRPSGTP
jgi:hypothetical protein